MDKCNFLVGKLSKKRYCEKPWKIGRYSSAKISRLWDICKNVIILSRKRLRDFFLLRKLIPGILILHWIRDRWDLFRFSKFSTVWPENRCSTAYTHAAVMRSTQVSGYFISLDWISIKRECLVQSDVGFSYRNIIIRYPLELKSFPRLFCMHVARVCTCFPKTIFIF